MAWLDCPCRILISLSGKDTYVCAGQIVYRRQLDKAVLGDTPQEPPSVVGNGVELTAQEKKALASAISDKTMDHWAWKTCKLGRVLTDSGQVVFPVEFASAIRKILA